MSFLVVRRAVGSQGGSSAAEADWLARSTGQGVVWAHDFRNQAEVDLFRWTSGHGGGNDPQALGVRALRCFHQTADGIAGTNGKCLEQIRPAGLIDSGGAWIRPFSAVNNNGRGFPDPAANGTVPVQVWAPTDGGDQTSTWGTKGVYGHSSFAGAGFDGTEFFLQMRVKMDPRRSTGGNETFEVGKLTFISHTAGSLTAQEIVTFSGATYLGAGTQNNHRMYVAGSPPIESLDSLARPGQQVGSNLANYGASQFCDVSTQPGNCWAWSGGFDTVMYNVVPGRPGVQETIVRVYAANEGQSSYTKIWDLVISLNYDFSNGYNALLTSTFNNNSDMPQEFWHRYTQIILSKNFIPCPQPLGFAAPSWFA